MGPIMGGLSGQGCEPGYDLVGTGRFSRCFGLYGKQWEPAELGIAICDGARKLDDLV